MRPRSTSPQGRALTPEATRKYLPATPPYNSTGRQPEIPPVSVDEFGDVHFVVDSMPEAPRTASERAHAAWLQGAAMAQSVVAHLDNVPMQDAPMHMRLLTQHVAVEKREGFIATVHASLVKKGQMAGLTMDEKELLLHQPHVAPSYDRSVRPSAARPPHRPPAGTQPAPTQPASGKRARDAATPDAKAPREKPQRPEWALMTQFRVPATVVQPQPVLQANPPDPRRQPLLNGLTQSLALARQISPPNDTGLLAFTVAQGLEQLSLLGNTPWARTTPQTKAALLNQVRNQSPGIAEAALQRAVQLLATGPLPPEPWQVFSWALQEQLVPVSTSASDWPWMLTALTEARTIDHLLEAGRSRGPAQGAQLAQQVQMRFLALIELLAQHRPDALGRLRNSPAAQFVGTAFQALLQGLPVPQAPVAAAPNDQALQAEARRQARSTAIARDVAEASMLTIPQEDTVLALALAHAIEQLETEGGLPWAYLDLSARKARIAQLTAVCPNLQAATVKKAMLFLDAGFPPPYAGQEVSHLVRELSAHVLPGHPHWHLKVNAVFQARMIDVLINLGRECDAGLYSMIFGLVLSRQQELLQALEGLGGNVQAAFTNAPCGFMVQAALEALSRGQPVPPADPLWTADALPVARATIDFDGDMSTEVVPHMENPASPTSFGSPVRAIDKEPDRPTVRELSAGDSLVLVLRDPAPRTQEECAHQMQQIQTDLRLFIESGLQGWPLERLGELYALCSDRMAQLSQTAGQPFSPEDLTAGLSSAGLQTLAAGLGGDPTARRAKLELEVRELIDGSIHADTHSAGQHLLRLETAWDTLQRLTQPITGFPVRDVAGASWYRNDVVLAVERLGQLQATGSVQASDVTQDLTVLRQQADHLVQEARRAGGAERTRILTGLSAVWRDEQLLAQASGEVRAHGMREGTIIDLLAELTEPLVIDDQDGRPETPS